MKNTIYIPGLIILSVLMFTTTSCKKDEKELMTCKLILHSNVTEFQIGEVVKFTTETTGISKVVYSVNGHIFHTATIAPFTTYWDTKNDTAGEYTISIAGTSFEDSSNGSGGPGTPYGTIHQVCIKEITLKLTQ
jgi:hypothetical protein